MIDWRDGGFEPTSPPNPAFPAGLDIDLARDALDSCVSPLPYPARRVGFFEIACRRCGLRVALTTAGRADDPRSIKVACRRL